MTVVESAGKSPEAMARKAGAVPVANSACVVVVSAEIVEDACRPPPMTTAFEVSAAAEVTQVAQAMVPVVVMVPPVIGEVVAMDETVADEVLQVEQEIAPAAEMAMGDVPERPEEPTAPMGS